MPQPPAAAPADILHLDHQFRPHPGDSPLRRLLAVQQAGRRLRPQRVQPFAQRAQFALGEAAADAARVVQRAGAVVEADMQRAEPATAAARRGPAEHDELLAPLALHLDPGLCTPGGVGRVGALADDALQPECAGAFAHGIAPAGEVVAVAQSLAPRDQALQRLLAVVQPAAAQIPAVQEQQVEQIQIKAVIPAAGERVLQLGKTGNPVVAQRHKLAVEHRVLRRRLGEQGRDGGQALRPVLAVSGDQADGAALLAHQQPVAVELYFAEPVLPVRRRIGQCRQLRRQVGRRRAADGAGRGCLPGAAGGRRRRLQRLGIGAFAFGGVVLLDEQPVLAVILRPRLQPDEDKSAVQPPAIEKKFQLAAPHPLFGVADRLPGAAIPGLHRAGAVLACGDAALEVGVVARMVLDMHGQPLVAGIERGAFRHRPAPQHAAVLQAEIPVQAAGGVFLDDEDRGGAARRVCRRRLRGHGKIAAGAIGVEAVAADGALADGGGRGHARPTPRRRGRLRAGSAGTRRRLCAGG